MDMQAALRARLVGQTAAGSRVYWLDRPQGTDLPAITLQTTGGDRPMTYSGFQAWRDPRVQFDAWATSYSEARAILEVAINALAPRETGNGVVFDNMGFEGERDGTERLGTKTIYRAGIDLIVRHEPA